MIERELVKCICAFQSDSDNPCGIASGNWGCGAFNGDAELKALIQLLAASLFRRELTYFTFGNTFQASALRNLFSLMQKHHVTTSRLYDLLIKYFKLIIAPNPGSNAVSLFNFIEIQLTPTFQPGSPVADRSKVRFWIPSFICLGFGAILYKSYASCNR